MANDPRVVQIQKLRDLCVRIRDRDKRNNEGTSQCQRLWKREIPETVDAIMSYATALETALWNEKNNATLRAVATGVTADDNN